MLRFNFFLVKKYFKVQYKKQLLEKQALQLPQAFPFCFDPG